MLFADGPNLDGFLDKLYLVAGSPLTYIAFLLLIFVWLGGLYLSFRKRVWELLPDKDRYSAAQLFFLGMPDTITANRLRVLGWRYLLLAYVVTLIFFLIMAGLLVYYLIQPGAEVITQNLAAQGAKLQEIADATQNLPAQGAKLQEIADATKRLDESLSEANRAFVLVGGVVRVKLRLEASKSTSIQAQARELQSLIDDYLTKVDRNTLPDAVKRQIEVSEAVAALARGEPDKAIPLANVETAEALIKQGQESMQEGVQRYRIIGRSHIAKKEWAKAVHALQRIETTALMRLSDRLSLGLAQLRDGKNADAERTFTRLIDAATAAQKGSKERFFLAAGYFMRGHVRSREDIGPATATAAADDYAQAGMTLDELKGEAIFRRFINVEFTVALCHYGRAKSLDKAGERRESLAALGEAIRRLHDLKVNANLPDLKVNANLADREDVDHLLRAALGWRAGVRMLPAMDSVNKGEETTATLADLVAAVADLNDLIDLDRSLKLQSELKEDHQVLVEVLLALGELRFRHGHYENSLGDFNAAVAALATLDREFKSSNQQQAVAALARAALIYAAAPEARLRDAEEAVECAEAAIKVLMAENLDVLSVLAAAHAEGGDYPLAIKHQDRAVTLAPEEHKTEMTRRLELYRKSQPYRLPPQKQLK